MTILVLLVIVATYFLPLGIAFYRKVPHTGSIAIVNIFTGWLLVGWVIALAMAFRDGSTKNA